MAELITLARPYARAAFEFARDRKELSSWQSALKLAASVSSDERVVLLFNSPNITASDKGNAFCDLCGDDLNDRQRNFIVILAENNRLGLLPQVFELFEMLKANQEKTVDVEILTAFEMSSDTEQALANTLKVRLDRDVELRTGVDRSLLGGALIRAGDTVIDGSARGRLAKLSEAVSN